MFDYPYKTEPRGKQGEVIEKSWREQCHAFLCRPGTGKSKIGLDTAGFNWFADRIDALIVIAPDGVDRQWIDEAVPRHLPDSIPRVCGNYRASMSKRKYENLVTLLQNVRRHTKLVILTLSFDGLQTPRGRALVALAQGIFRTMVIDDESHRTSNIRSAVFKAVKPVMRAARVRRIGTGTLIRQNPFSAYGQFDLMADGLLGFHSLSSFKSMYAQLLPHDHPMVQGIAIRNARRMNRRDPATGKLVVRQIRSIIAKDEDERPIYRNLADLRRRLERVSSFLTLADVNGKEPVVNEDTVFVELTKEQRLVYDELVRYGVAMAPGGQLTAEGALALSIRLAQVAGGFMPSDDDPQARPVGDENPKMQHLIDLLEDLPDEKVVIWCKFSAELDAVAATLAEVWGDTAVVSYHGRKTSKEKDAAKRAFIDDSQVRFFVGQQKAGGTGLDGLQGVSHYMVFYSNDYPYLERLQAISRLARTDGADVVQVYDLVAEGTIDEDVVKTLRTAQDVSEAVLARAIVREWE